MLRNIPKAPGGSTRSKLGALRLASSAQLSTPGLMDLMGFVDLMEFWLAFFFGNSLLWICSLGVNDGAEIPWAQT